MSRAPAPLRDRLYSRLVPEPATGCLLWTGSIDPNGYGRIWVGSKPAGTAHPARVHTVAWELDNGSVPDGLVLDHVRARGCVYRHCANVAHLEPVTIRVNTLRGDTIAAASAARTHCPARHPYDEANTRVTGGKRYCRTCHREDEARRRARRRSLTSAQAMEALGIKQTKFYELIAAGELVAVRIPTTRGKRQELRVEPAEIEAFITRNRTARAS